MEYKYKISVVMAVYNVEPFLRESIESVITQDIGLENIQLILVDDGTPDDSGLICDEYAEKYPDNIVVIHKENGGVSSARNIGIQHAEGRYVNFLDSDDKFSKNTFSMVYNFFEKNDEYTDVVAVPRVYFEGRTDENNLNYKFKKGNRVIDLRHEPTMILNTSSTAFFKNEIVKTIDYNTRLKYSEDTLYVCECLLNKMTLGVVKGCKHLTRKRVSGALSATQQAEGDGKNFLMPINYLTIYLLDKCNKEYGYVPKFIQFTLLYELQWKLIMENYPSAMSVDEIEEFENKLDYVLNYIDDDIIMRQKHMGSAVKNMCICRKHKDIKIYRTENDLHCYYNNFNFFSFSRIDCKLEFLNIDNNNLSVEGILYIPFNNVNLDVVAYLNENRIECTTQTIESRHKSLGKEIWTTVIFRCVIALDNSVKGNKIQFKGVIDGSEFGFKRMIFGKFFPISANLGRSFSCISDWIVYSNKKFIFVDAYSKEKENKHKKLFHKELWSLGKKGARKAVLARIMYSFLAKFKRKKLWLITDRVNKADDNGQAFFEFLNKEHKEINSVFVINKNSPDYMLMKKIGKVVSPDTWSYKILFLMCDAIISSHADDIILNPFHDYKMYYQDLIKHKFVFLQHGITKDDLSHWLNKYNMNLAMIATAANAEYKSFFDGAYYYDEKVIKLTGFTRFDKLLNNEKNIITIMPTWRSYLVTGFDGATGLRGLKNGFENSKYYDMYVSLLNNENLINKCKEKNYKIQFMIHPNMTSAMDKFKFNEYVEILDLDTSYNKIFAESNLVITDYSSVVFDFAYLRKPVIYYRADADEFFSGNHTYDKGYFEYERDGFGEVEYSAEAISDRIIEYIENDCKLKDKYRERIDNFFAFNDKNNCKRIFDEIIKL